MINKTITSFAGVALASAMLLAATPAFAQTATTTGGTQLSTIIARGNADIAARITALNALNTRVQTMVNESATEKASISSEIQTNITGLTSLQTTLDAKTTVASARTEVSSIFTSFRIYMLVLPQGWTLASADRVTVITGLMTNLGTKMQTRITADQTAGKNVSALVAAMTDMNTQIANANAQAADAQSGVASLVPDQGNTTVEASNKAALVAARANITTATQDLKAARADISTILQGLKTLG
jgi:hypothetical protein